MPTYQVKILKIGSLRSIIKNISSASIHLAEESVIHYLFKQCYGDLLQPDHSNSIIKISIHSEDEMKFKLDLSVKNKGEFEFSIEILKDNSIQDLDDISTGIIKVA